MTKRQYIIANFLKKFGILRKQKRLLDAANELQLLKDAEEILGRRVWENLEDIEDYKINYWTISKLLQEKSSLSEKIHEIKFNIDNIKQNQVTRFKEHSRPETNIEEMYDKQKIVVEKIKAEQEDISDIAASIKRSYDGAIAKLAGITDQHADSVEISKEKAKIEHLKQKFSALKDKKLISDKKLVKQTAILEKISNTLQSSKSSYKDNAAGNYEVMGKANKAISAYRAKIGLLDNQIISNYSEIGQKISQDSFKDSACRKAVDDSFNLCKIIISLRDSINYNYVLSGR